MTSDLRELRLTFSADGMARVIKTIDAMSLGEMPEHMAVFLALASDASNWHEVEQ